MKRLLRDAGIPGPRFVTLTDTQRESVDYQAVVAEVGEPCFVKPANMGSSVGVYKTTDEASFTAALASAFEYDRKVLVEEAIVGREIECSVLGNEEPIASVPGEVTPTHDFYSYEAKYLDENGALLKIPADLPEATVERVQELAVRAFQVLCCEGMARVDVFLRGEDEVLVNEINTIPGFTKISMYPKLWAASGINYTDLIDRLIQLALDRHAKENALRTSYEG
jgi:D-alanine-D-alanine ligase